MINFDAGIDNFLRSPDQYVLRLKGQTLTAEKRGLFTWLRANIFSRYSYRLPLIFGAMRDRGIEVPQWIDREELKERLKQKAQRYSLSHPGHISEQLIEDIFAAALPSTHVQPPVMPQAASPVPQAASGKRESRVEPPVAFPAKAVVVPKAASPAPQAASGKSEGHVEPPVAFPAKAVVVPKAASPAPQAASGKSEGHVEPPVAFPAKAVVVPQAASSSAREPPPPQAANVESESRVEPRTAFPTKDVVQQTLDNRLERIKIPAPKTEEQLAFDRAETTVRRRMKMCATDEQRSKAIEQQSKALEEEYSKELAGKGDPAVREKQERKEAIARNNAIGLQLMAKANFQISPVVGDGNCLFSSIAVGMLARIPREELIRKFDGAVQRASEAIRTYGPKYNFTVDLHVGWAEIRNRLSALEASYEIANMQGIPEVRNCWVALLRGLSIAMQLEWSQTKGGPPLDDLIFDHGLGCSPIEYLNRMMLPLPADQIIWGSSSDILALQESLGVSIPYLDTQRSGRQEKVVLIQSQEPLPLDDLKPTDIVLLFDPGGKHYDPAFYIPPPREQ